MKKSTVDSLIDNYINEDNEVNDNVNICFVTNDDQFVITTTESDIELHKVDDAIQINYPDSTVLLSYEAIKIIEIS